MHKKPLFLLLLAIIILFPLNFQTGENFLRADEEGYIGEEGVGGTRVSRDITEDEVWTKENSPYRIINQVISINRGAKLTIEPGVVVKMNRGNIIVLGELEALGNKEEEIVFTSLYDDEEGGDSTPDNNREPQKGDWGLIGVILDSARLTFNYVTVQYGGIFHSVVDGSSSDVGAFNIAAKPIVRISNSKIIKNATAFFVWDADFEMHDSIIMNNDRGLINEDHVTLSGYEEGLDVLRPVAAHNYWGNLSGPYHETLNPYGTGNPIAGEPVFIPWLTEPPHTIGIEEEKRNPVIIVPGIMGSYLYSQLGEEIWPNIAKLVIDPWDLHLKSMELPESGIPEVGSELVPNDIFRQISDKDFFQGLIGKLTDNGYVEGESLFVFPYDWRLDIGQMADNVPSDNTRQLLQKIMEIKQQTGSEKVDIIAHSMGGLLAKNYIKYYGKDSVDKFIDIATPHLGAPKAAKILMYGDNLGFVVANRFGLSSFRAKEMSKNFPSVFQLLPSSNYFGENDLNYNSYLADVFDLDGNGEKGNMSFAETDIFFKNLGYNEQLLERKNLLHNDIDNYSPVDDGIETINIVGCSQATPGKMFVLNKEKSGKYEYALKYIDGDGTVPLRSSEVMRSNEVVYINNGEHAFLPGTNGITDYIAAKLSGDDFVFDDYANISRYSSFCSISGTQVSFHSPIDLHIYDSQGRHVGPLDNGDIEMSIPGVQYDDIDDNKFVFLPRGQEYQIKGVATDTGTFNARIQNIDNGVYDRLIYYNDVPLSTIGETLEFKHDENNNDFLIEVDIDNDGTPEQTFSPTTIIEDEAQTDLEKPTTDFLLQGEVDDDGDYINEARLELIAHDNTGGVGLLKTEYSLDGGQTWTLYASSTVFNQAGDYHIEFFSTDLIGNMEGLRSVDFSIIFQERKVNIAMIIDDVEKLWLNGGIKKQGIKNGIIQSLQSIQKQIEIAERSGSILKKINNKVIVLRLKLLLELISVYDKKEWVSGEGYAIIKEDINNLIKQYE